MGLALTGVIGGFGSSLEMRHKIRIGWLSPLLGLLIAFDLTSFWMVAWQLRAAIPVNFFSLAGGLIIFGVYYLIAQLAFPDDLDQWPDLDTHYLEHRRWLISGMWMCNVLAIAGQMAMGLHPFAQAANDFAFVAFTLGALGLMFAPGRRTNVALLLYQIALYPLLDVLGAMGPAN